MSNKYSVAHLFLIKKDKAAFRNITNWINGQAKVTDITLAKSVSSVMTHILIEMEGARTSTDSVDRCIGYRLFDWSKLFDECITGKETVEEVLEDIRKMISDV